MTTTFNTKRTQRKIELILTLLAQSNLTSTQLQLMLNMSATGINRYMRHLIDSSRVSVVGLGKGKSGDFRAHTYALANTPVQVEIPLTQKAPQKRRSRGNKKHEHRSIGRRFIDWLTRSRADTKAMAL